VEDPGHSHKYHWEGGGGFRTYDGGHNSSAEYDTSYEKTGITIENLPAKSAVSVSVDANDAGEHLPLVYVLICQKVA
jgi:hypothetical protein